MPNLSVICREQRTRGVPGTKRQNRYRHKANKESHRSIFPHHTWSGRGGGGQRGISRERGCRCMCDTENVSQVLLSDFYCRIWCRKVPLMREKSYSRISMWHNLRQHPGNKKVLPSDFCCCNCCHKGKESECSSNCGSRNPRIRLFQHAAASCATLKSESKTPKSTHATKKSPHGTPLILVT